MASSGRAGPTPISSSSDSTTPPAPATHSAALPLENQNSVGRRQNAPTPSTTQARCSKVPIGRMPSGPARPSICQDSDANAAR